LFDEAGEDAMLRMSAPRGDYYWQPTGTPVVCLTAGIGVTPALAILRSRQREGWKEPLHLDCSVRQEAERVGVEEFQAASAADPTVTARWRVTTTEGRLSRAEVEDLNKKFAGAEYFLCGPIPYMNAVSALLSDVGVKPERIRIETFASAAEQPAKTARAPPAAVAPAKPESKKALRGLLGSMFGKRK
jgi:ferredoxin-NADP reductase